MTISAPTGGATLGGIATQGVTTLDDDEPGVVAEIPTINDVGKLLLAGLLGTGGRLLLSRRRGLVAPVVALTLALGGLDAAEASRS